MAAVIQKQAVVLPLEGAWFPLQFLVAIWPTSFIYNICLTPWAVSLRPLHQIWVQGWSSNVFACYKRGLKAMYPLTGSFGSLHF